MSTLKGTCHGCVAYGTAAVRFHASCQWLPLPVMGVGSMARLRCVFTRVVNGLQHLAGVYGPWNSCGAPSRELSMDYSTLQVCMVYGTAAVRLHSSCQRLTAPCLGVWPTAQLRCAFTRGVTAYSTLHVCMVYCTPVNVVYDLQLSCGTTLR